MPEGNRCQEFKSIMESLEKGELGKEGFYVDRWTAEYDGDEPDENLCWMALRDEETDEQLFTVQDESPDTLRRQADAIDDFLELIDKLKEKGFEVRERGENI